MHTTVHATRHTAVHAAHHAAGTLHAHIFA
jgi:hypothetical protein